MTVLYKANMVRGAEWARFFAERAPDVPFRLWPDIGDPADGALSGGVGAAGRYRDDLSQSRAGLLGRCGRGSVRRHKSSAAHSARAHAGARHRRDHGRIRHHGRARPASRSPALHQPAEGAGLARDPDHAGQTSSCRRDGARPARPGRARTAHGVRLSASRLESFAARDRRRHLLRRHGDVAGVSLRRPTFSSACCR